MIPAIAATMGCAEKSSSQAPEDPNHTPVYVGQASQRRVQYVLDQVGTLEANREVTVRSEINGVIVEIAFTEGKPVEEGQLLVKLDSAKIQAEIRNLQARIHQFQVRLANKQRSLARNRPLVEGNLVSRQHFDDIQTDLAEIQTEIAQAKADLARQKELLADAEIRAPFAGVAGVRKISLGDYLDVGDPVLAIVDLNPLEISFRVPEKFKADLYEGQSVALHLDPYPHRTFEGTVSFIAPRVDIDTRTFLVKARVENSDHLLNPGMFARVEVITEVHEQALTVPWESVIQTEDGVYLYTVDAENTARKVPVRLGKVTSEWAEVLDSDLTPGSKVILEGKYAVKDGMRVAVKHTS
jgi:membrane fusion protein (multidrug efflux system)